MNASDKRGSMVYRHTDRRKTEAWLNSNCSSCLPENSTTVNWSEESDSFNQQSPQGENLFLSIFNNNNITPVFYRKTQSAW